MLIVRRSAHAAGRRVVAEQPEDDALDERLERRPRLALDDRPTALWLAWSCEIVRHLDIPYRRVGPASGLLALALDGLALGLEQLLDGRDQRV